MGWETQDDNESVKVQVNGGYKKTGEPRTDFLIIDKSTGEHNHISVDTTGKITEHHDYR